MIVYSSYAKVGHPQAPILKRPQHYVLRPFLLHGNIGNDAAYQGCKTGDIEAPQIADRKKPGASTGLKSI
jgi:hypothetical protein